MALLALPAELRLRIYSYVEDLKHGREEEVALACPLTPAICRTNLQLRRETIVTFAENAYFIVAVGAFNARRNPRLRLQIWLNALGDGGLARVRSVQFDRNWDLPLPERWQGHVGFYVRLEKHDGLWQCSTGTCPMARDSRAMRQESAELLRRVIYRRLQQPRPAPEDVLTRCDAELIFDAMNMVAMNPLPTYDIDQTEAGRQRRRQTWMDIERKLLALAHGGSADSLR